MTTLKIKIKDCRSCPFFKSERYYTDDSFEHANDWFCHHNPKNVKEIAGYVEWHEESKIPIPNWCPVKV